jgi:hypothetical protein
MPRQRQETTAPDGVAAENASAAAGIEATATESQTITAATMDKDQNEAMERDMTIADLIMKELHTTKPKDQDSIVGIIEKHAAVHKDGYLVGGDRWVFPDGSGIIVGYDGGRKHYQGFVWGNRRKHGRPARLGSRN